MRACVHVPFNRLGSQTKFGKGGAVVAQWIRVSGSAAGASRVMKQFWDVLILHTQKSMLVWMKCPLNKFNVNCPSHQSYAAK